MVGIDLQNVSGKNFDLDYISDILSIIGTLLSTILTSFQIRKFITFIKNTKKYSLMPDKILIYNNLFGICFYCFWLRTRLKIPQLSGIISFIPTFIFSFIYFYSYSDKRFFKCFLAILLYFLISIPYIYVLVILVPKTSTVGLILLIINLFLFIDPAKGVIDSMLRKDITSIQFSPIFLGSLNSLCWFGYCYIKNIFYGAIRCALGFGLCLVQMIVYLYVKSSKKKKKEKYILMKDQIDDFN